MRFHPSHLLTVLLSVLLLSSGQTPAWAAAEQTVPPLTDADCIKCHRQPARDIAERGGAHKTAIGCFDCHQSHPPAGKAVIPSCSDCHGPKDAAHFALQGCQDCHAPHAPGISDLSALPDATAACLTCHEAVGKDFKQHPSLHADQACTDCHSGHGLASGQFSPCLDCHEPHQEGMQQQDCTGCHAPHRPTAYAFSPSTPTRWCAACHEETVASLDAHGGAHKTAITCSDCHQNHPPAESGVIPACADCHAPGAAEHYRVDGCLRCHNPHEPLRIDMSAVSPVKPICLSCHAAPGREMHNWPSAHAEMDCNECHAEHGLASSCLDCHDGHSSDMAYADCLKCHQPHSPTALQFGQSGIAPQLCGSCHRQPLKELGATDTEHGNLECVFCHRRTHKVILSCDNCHGQPHDAGIHRQFSDCNHCHQGPHALRN